MGYPSGRRSVAEAGRNTVNKEESYLLLSQLAHAGYCLRRAGLLMNEQVWIESADTAKGRMEHKRVHAQRIERRGDQIKLYEYDVFSDTLELRGKCDCIEVLEDKTGCRIPSVEFPVRLYPIEYKHGKIRSEEEYEIQLCAQAMCLEEMFRTNIPEGALFYISSHRRYPVSFTEELRQKVRDTVTLLRKMQDEHSIPRAEYSSKCKKCSLYDICMPKIQYSARTYCDRIRQQAQEVEQR